MWTLSVQMRREDTHAPAKMVTLATARPVRVKVRLQLAACYYLTGVGGRCKNSSRMRFQGQFKSFDQLYVYTHKYMYTHTHTWSLTRMCTCCVSIKYLCQFVKPMFPSLSQRMMTVFPETTIARKMQCVSTLASPTSVTALKATATRMHAPVKVRLAITLALVGRETVIKFTIIYSCKSFRFSRECFSRINILVTITK